MQRSAATVVCVTGDGAERAVTGIAAANVGVCALPTEEDALERAMLATQAAASAHVPYFVHDADPLELVAESWVRLFDEGGPIGELEVATAETLVRWRAQTLELPDYYLVTAADAMTPTRRHWYFGVLHAAAPARVVPVPSSPAALVDAIEELQPTRWWPRLPDLLDGIERRVPDRVDTTVALGGEPSALITGPQTGALTTSRQSGSIGIETPGSRPRRTARVTATDPNRSCTSSSAASSASRLRRSNGSAS